MTQIYEWAIQWGIPVTAIHELLMSMGAGFDTPQLPPPVGTTEAAAQNIVRLEAGRKKILIFRNNVGVLEDRNGRPVRYGLCNDTPALNASIKSGDLIGVRRVLITRAMVGYHIGQFVSREVKEVGWKYTGTPREMAQLKWANLIIGHGGDAAFTTGEGSL